MKPYVSADNEMQKRLNVADYLALPEMIAGAGISPTAEKIDSEIKRIVTEAHEKARAILSTNREKLEKVTRRLLEVEVMEGDELRALLATSG